jgi:hypothetical protein
MKIEKYFESDLKNEIRVKVICLAKDAGFRFAEDEINHICQRMPEILKEKFNHYDIEIIWAAWDKGSTGQFGVQTKITINNLIAWIYAKNRENQEANRHNSDAFKYVEWHERHDTPFSEFVCWLRRECGVYPQDLDPKHNPSEKQSVSPILKEMEPEYYQHKKNRTLEMYRRILMPIE